MWVRILAEHISLLKTRYWLHRCGCCCLEPLVYPLIVVSKVMKESSIVRKYGAELVDWLINVYFYEHLKASSLNGAELVLTVLF